MWDRKIPFENLLMKLRNELNLLFSLFYSSQNNKKLLKKIVYVSIAFIQLANGLRAGEAVEAFKKWIKENKDEVLVRIEKLKNEEYRYALIPTEIKMNRGIIEASVLKAFGNVDNIKKKNYIKFFLTNYKINTHTLRKAWESYVARTLNKDLALITSFQGRKNVKSHLVYLRMEEAKETIKKHLKELFY